MGKREARNWALMSPTIRVDVDPFEELDEEQILALAVKAGLLKAQDADNIMAGRDQELGGGDLGRATTALLRGDDVFALRHLETYLGPDWHGRLAIVRK